MILIKLGGSVITDKSEYKKFNREQTARLCAEIAASGKGVLVVHGAGSYGHVLSKQYQLQHGLQDFRQIPAVAQVQHDVRELSLNVVEEMIKVGMPAVSVPPGSCFVMDNGRLIVDNPESIKALAHIGVMPVLFGDVVADRSKGFGICSGDQAMEALAKIFKPDRIVFVSDVDGLYTADPKKDENAKLIPEVDGKMLDKLDSELTVADVTGGIRGKVDEMLKICGDSGECILVNGTVPGRLLSLLRGEDVPCTKVRP
ncbi:MAG: isopentenyl phosphate kinase family protein [Candidatus Methanomethylophilaceae archaeon]|jgi:isopentenyl phosphate kinase|nr:isopentenyl phosphate kinase family protein [Candidatus Methanomethylophilaceae archaeon]